MPSRLTLARGRFSGYISSSDLKDFPIASFISEGRQVDRDPVTNSTTRIGSRSATQVRLGQSMLDNTYNRGKKDTPATKEL